MPVLIPVLIAGALAAGAVALKIITLGTALLVTGLAAVQSALSYFSQPRQRGAQGVGSQREELTRRLQRRPTAPARWIFGTTRVGGIMIFYLEPIKRVANIMIALSEGALTNVENVWVNEESAMIRVGYQLSNTGRGAWYYAINDSLVSPPVSGGIHTQAPGTTCQITPGAPWRPVDGFLIPPAVFDEAEGRALWAARFSVRQIAASSTETRCETRIERLIGVPLRRFFSIAPAAGNKYANFLTVQQFFGHSPRESLQHFVNIGHWPENGRIENISTISVSMTEPDVDFEDRIYQRFPNLQFSVRGLRLPDPETPGVSKWSNNAAIVRKWWMTERRGIPESAIDDASFQAAVEVCGQIVTAYPLPADLQTQNPTRIRYSIDGVVFSDDDPEQVEREMDFAWQGYVVEVNGMHFFRPGADRIPAVRINPDDITSLGEVTLSPALNERLNACTMRLPQSDEHQLQEYSMPPTENLAAQTRDGRRLLRDLGPRAFVSPPATAARLQAIFLRRAEQSETVSLTLKPGDNFRFHALQPTDTVLLTLPEIGADNARYIVELVRRAPDGEVGVSLRRGGIGTYADSTTVPAMPERPYGGRAPIVLRNMSAVAVSPAHDPTGPRSVIRVSWQPEGLVQVRFRDADGNKDQYFWGTSAEFVPSVSPATIVPDAGVIFPLRLRAATEVGVFGASTGVSVSTSNTWQRPPTEADGGG